MTIFEEILMDIETFPEDGDRIGAEDFTQLDDLPTKLSSDESPRRSESKQAGFPSFQIAMERIMSQHQLADMDQSKKRTKQDSETHGDRSSKKQNLIHYLLSETPPKELLPRSTSIEQDTLTRPPRPSIKTRSKDAANPHDTRSARASVHALPQTPAQDLGVTGSGKVRIVHFNASSVGKSSIANPISHQSKSPSLSTSRRDVPEKAVLPYNHEEVSPDSLRSGSEPPIDNESVIDDLGFLNDASSSPVEPRLTLAQIASAPLTHVTNSDDQYSPQRPRLPSEPLASKPPKNFGGFNISPTSARDVNREDFENLFQSLMSQTTRDVQNLTSDSADISIVRDSIVQDQEPIQQTQHLKLQQADQAETPSQHSGIVSRSQRPETNQTFQQLSIQPLIHTDIVPIGIDAILLEDQHGMAAGKGQEAVRTMLPPPTSLRTESAQSKEQTCPQLATRSVETSESAHPSIGNKNLRKFVGPNMAASATVVFPLPPQSCQRPVHTVMRIETSPSPEAPIASASPVSFFTEHRNNNTTPRKPSAKDREKRDSSNNFREGETTLIGNEETPVASSPNSVNSALNDDGSSPLAAQRLDSLNRDQGTSDIPQHRDKYGDVSSVFNSITQDIIQRFELAEHEVTLKREILDAGIQVTIESLLKRQEEDYKKHTEKLLPGIEKLEDLYHRFRNRIETHYKEGLQAVPAERSQNAYKEELQALDDLEKMLEE